MIGLLIRTYEPLRQLVGVKFETQVTVKAVGFLFDLNNVFIFVIVEFKCNCIVLLFLFLIPLLINNTKISLSWIF